MESTTRVLVVDDSPVLLELGVALAREAGYAAAGAPDGREALRRAAEWRPDLVLLDVALPDLSGVEVCRRLKAAPETCTCLVALISSAETASDRQAEGLEAGADAYITRPIPNRELLARLAALDRLKRTEDELRRSRAEALAHLQAAQSGEARFRALLESAPDALIMVDGSGVLTFVNQQGLALFGYTESELVGQPIEILIPQRFHERHVGLRNGFLSQLSPGRAQVGRDLTGRRKDGSELDVSLSLSTIAGPQGFSVLVAVRDVSERQRMERALATRTQHLDALLQAFHAMTSGQGLQEILDRVLDEAVRISEVPHVKLLLLDRETNLLRVGAIKGSAMPKEFVLPVGVGLSGLVAQRGEPLFVADTQRDPRSVLSARDRELGILTYLGLPIKRGTEILGVLTFNTTVPRRYSQEEQTLLVSFAEQAAIAIENARLHEASRQLAGQLKTLNDLGRNLSTALDLSLVAARICRAARTLLPDSVGRLWERTGKDGALRLIGSAGLRRPEGGQEFRAGPRRGLIGVAEETRQPVVSVDVRTDPRFVDLGWAEAEGLASCIVLPLEYGERLVGFLTIFTRRTHRFPAEEVDLLRSFAAQAAIAMQNARLYAEEQRQRARLKEILDSAVEGFYQSTPDGRILAANPTLARILGYESPEALMGSVTDVGASYCDPGRRAEFARQVAEQGRVTDFEAELRRPDGRTVWVAMNARGVRDGAGRLLCYEGFVQDISERKQAEQLKADFVSFATHQLRTPLAGIKWLLELAVQEAGMPDESRDLLGDARASTERLIKLVNDLLDATRLERRKVVLELQAVDLGELVASVVEELRPLVAARAHRLTVAAPPGSAVARGDPQLLRQVVLNLLSNAVKYTPDGGRIAVSADRVSGGERPMVSLSVRDTGVGIPSAAMPRLFEKFFRAENVLVLETEGTGLGLYIVRLIVEQHGGRIGCRSEEGQGTTFTAELPAYQNEEGKLPDREER